MYGDWPMVTSRVNAHSGPAAMSGLSHSYLTALWGSSRVTTKKAWGTMLGLPSYPQEYFSYQLYIFFWGVGFYTDVIQLSYAGLPLMSCFGSLGHLLCRGPTQHPCSLMPLMGQGQCQQCLNDVGHCDTPYVGVEILGS